MAGLLPCVVAVCAFKRVLGEGSNLARHYTVGDKVESLQHRDLVYPHLQVTIGKGSTVVQHTMASGHSERFDVARHIHIRRVRGR